MIDWTPRDNAQRQLRRAHVNWHELEYCRGNRGDEILLESEDGIALQWVRPEQLT